MQNNIDRAVAINHPIGHAHHIPVAPRLVFASKIASTTRRMRSVKVAIMNGFIAPEPRSTPSAANFAATTK